MKIKIEYNWSIDVALIFNNEQQNKASLIKNDSTAMDLFSKYKSDFTFVD